MSLDVYLKGETTKVQCVCNCCENEHEREETEELYWSNITHNLNKMAGEAGIYQVVWRPEENGIEKAAQLIEPLTEGLTLLRSDPERFKKFNPSNGWGDYDNLLEWLDDYLKACKQYPEATVKASR